ncbi:bifunctional riboflavin kinase/FMN adenylyltransferase [Acidipila sp. EB88]|uniref:bifunctional riboflavin kinase/FMN adenylyltransferase n=1 Tax=Acidipila sp. EB88 TaxID=2305226 RepID=UPI000F5D5398|nr:bifunctional riboflavin kinase/FMN adenylyltransferase [Acidipila sp. EB88]RRA47483.1 bifunctional riboflavin kinase/FMN adenylyltransferase [Acidipila sp. EB88]
MLVSYGLDQVSAALNPGHAGRPSVVAIGNFDGVHCGHKAILSDVCARAKAQNARAVVITFDPHPLRVLRPADAPPLLTPLPQRLALLAETGVDATLVLPFTPAFSLQSARDFATSVLVDGVRAIAVHEGDNFRFGYQASAGLAELRALGTELGFSVVAHGVLRRRGVAVSSSSIRSLVATGQVEQARFLLGRPFSIVSRPARGRGIGTRLLVPTVNLAAYPELKPGHGVYVTELTIGASGQESGMAPRRFAAITNAGNRPTFGEDSYAIESHLLDFDPDTAPPLELTESTPLELAFLHRLRGEQRFPSPEALRAQIGIDIARARRYHRLTRRLAGGLHHNAPAAQL